jgi:phosphonate transport system permease protein
VTGGDPVTPARVGLPRKTRTASSVALTATLLVLVGITVAGFFLLDAGKLNIPRATGKLAADLGKMLSRPVAVHFTLLEALKAVLVTLGLGFLTTLIGAVFALVFGLLAARNLSKPAVVTVLKGFVAFIRAVPTVLWVLIFAIGAGLGSVAAVVGMSFHSFGYLLKAYSEAFEELDKDILEALRASGANWMQVVVRAVIPSSMGQIVSWTFMRFEINFTNAVAMGAAAGAGGIGFDLFMASGFYFNIGEVGFITWLILGVAILMEIGATWLKRTQHVHR